MRKHRVVGRERVKLGERQLVPLVRRTVPTQSVQRGRLRQPDRLEEIGVDDGKPGTEYAEADANSAGDADGEER